MERVDLDKYIYVNTNNQEILGKIIIINLKKLSKFWEFTSKIIFPIYLWSITPFYKKKIIHHFYCIRVLKKMAKDGLTDEELK